MKAIKNTIIAAAALCAGFGASAQEASRTAYFLDGYSYRHELNPAFGGERNYISIPVLANMNMGLFSNVGVNTFLYPTTSGPYKLTTFMSPTVDADEFLGKLKNMNHINMSSDITLLSAGFKAFKGYNTITVGIHADMGVGLPKDLFTFMKLGQTGEDTRYNFKDINASANAWAEIALGHSHKINEKLTIGAKVKFLLGIASLKAKIENMDVRMNNNAWTINAQGSMEIAAGSGLYVPTKQETGADYNTPSEADLIEWNDVEYNNFGLSGFGLGFDLGATYQLLPDLQLSAAVTDLGFMSYSHAVKGATSQTSWVFDGFHNIAIDDNAPDYEENKIDEQIDRLWDDLQDVVNFHRTEQDASFNRALFANIRLGAEYKMPFYKNLTGAFLFTSHIAGVSTWNEGRFYATVKPVKWFDATINYGISTYGDSFGWMLNFHPKGFNFFVGTDHQSFKVTPQGIPVGKANFNLNLGFNVTFGS